MKRSLRIELARDVANNKYEISEAGVLFPRSKLVIGGVFQSRVLKANGEDTGWDKPSPNIIVNQGLDHVLDVVLSAATQITTWYLAVFKADYTILASDTASDISTDSTEIEGSDVDETVRETWIEAGVSSQSITNSASKAEYNIAATFTAYGAFLISNSTIGGSTGTLFGGAKFATSRAVVNTDDLQITYTVSAADA